MPHGDVGVADVDAERLRSLPDGVHAAPPDEVARQDVVIAAVPFAALEQVLEAIRDHVPATSVVMDVVSTKARATELLQRVLGDHPNVLATHPLFGPPSMQRMEAGQRIVVTDERGDAAAAFLEFLEEEFGLEVLRLSPDDHDRAMAYMQSLPFFIARALVSIGILDLPNTDELSIPSFRKLAEIASIEEHHTHEMFETSQRSNPYAQDARREFLKALAQLQDELEPD